MNGTKELNLGQIVVTTNCWVTLTDNGDGDQIGFLQDVESLLQRHRSGDWGEVCEEDWKSNDDAVKHGDRVLSSYTISDHAVWVITEWDRSVTTVLFPEDY